MDTPEAALESLITVEQRVLAGTSWLQGFLDGREEGFKIGLKLGLLAATQELEHLIKEHASAPR